MVRVGQQLGNYRLTHLSRPGNFAEVYLSKHIYLGTQNNNIGCQDNSNNLLPLKIISFLVPIALILSIVLGGCSGTPFTNPSTNNTPSSQSTQTANKHKLFVFLSGFTSSLSPSDVAANNGYGSDPSFFGNNHIQPFLQNKFPGSYFLEYSYHGFTADGKPLPYACALSVDSHIADLAVGLRSQINQFLRSHANTDVYVIGHSLGGVIAFSFLAQMIEGKNNLLHSLPNGGTLKGIFTLDSPIGGVTDNWFYSLVARYFAAFNTANCNGWSNLLGMPIVKELNDLFNSATQPESRGTTANVDTTITLLNQNNNQTVALDALQNGVKVSTFGNSSDTLWQPSLCNNNLTDFLSTQWLSEVPSGINKQGGAIYARSFSAGTLACINKDNQGNHLFVFSDQNVQTAIWQVITGSAPDALTTVSIPPAPTPVLVPTPTPVPTASVLSNGSWQGQGTYYNGNSPFDMFITITSVNGEHNRHHQW